jgi:hypothetical protein
MAFSGNGKLHRVQSASLAFAKLENLQNTSHQPPFALISFTVVHIISAQFFFEKLNSHDF